ncbi:BadF/BadG/BcrA/BcrD ATPase family protein [Agromyces sp. Marseille-P2726]|uniref:BadF/BadG/BcrA/BcrD ATPase family protein n=1 Tax=Agromyces sp. Marseille-P2726 TaxID=2709132 RepID=UPI0020C2728B|nr:BadF/BadG/BcrA/BcrD ATPase family protein [Agromyces sp. Marseille-P2726]
MSTAPNPGPSAVDPTRHDTSSGWILGIDVGGTGSRAALERFTTTSPDERQRFDGARVSVDSGGSTVLDVAASLIEAVRLERPDAAIAAVGVGATGLASLVSDPVAGLERLAAAAGGASVALAVDAVTAHLGALGGRGGAVVAVGTGAIAIGTDLGERWKRVGGWGHLFDDRGSGAWIGIEGLKAAIRTHDGVTTDAAALLAAAVERFGSAPSWPGQLLGRPDRAALLAEFAADVAGLADSDDPVASDIMRRAGAGVAATLAAALDPGIPPLAAGTGGVFSAGGVFAAAFEREFARLAPHAELVAPAGSPLDGAVRLAGLVVSREVVAGHPPFVWMR